MLDAGWPPVWRLLLLVLHCLAVSSPAGNSTHHKECKVFSAGNSTNECPAGALALTQEECQDADAEFKGVEFGWASVIDSSTDPKGCFRFGQNFYFNTHATGTEFEERSPFCKLCLPDAGASNQAYVCAVSTRLSPGQLNGAEFRCEDGGCLPVAAYCDGTFDCRDGSDETGCAAMSALGHDAISEVEVAAAASGGSPQFDCHASGSTEWSAEKKSWCCKNLHVGCASEQEKGEEEEGSFDCDAQKATWETSWSMPKRKWCCDNRKIGCQWHDCYRGPSRDWTSSKKVFCCRHHKETCPVKIDEDADGGSTQPDKPFDCRAGVLTWKVSWTNTKQKWCCEHHRLGCRRAPAGNAGADPSVYNCTEDANVGSWDERKRDWCCHHEARACPVAHYLLAPAGQGSCPSGYQSILDHSMCKAAATALGGEECADEHVVNADTRDFTCTVTSTHGCVHFDDRHRHSSQESFRFVCVKALGMIASAGSAEALTHHSVSTTESAALSNSSMAAAPTTNGAVVLPRPIQVMSTASTTSTATTTEPKTMTHSTIATIVAATTIAGTTANTATTMTTVTSNVAHAAITTTVTTVTTISATTATTTTTASTASTATTTASKTLLPSPILTSTTTSSEEPAPQPLRPDVPTPPGQKLPEVVDAPLQCSVDFTGETGSLEDRCLAGNRFNDGFEYVFNSQRYTNHSECGSDLCWCCRRRITPALWHANLECSVGFAKDTGSLKNRCEAGNGGDSFQYVYNKDRGTEGSCGECFCCRRPLAPLEQVYEFPIYMPGLMDTFEERCQYGNKIDDGYDYLFNHNRGKKDAVCGENARYWCCRRRTPEALQVWQVEFPVKVWNKMSTGPDVKQVGEKSVGAMVRGRLVDRTWVALYHEPGFVLAFDRDIDMELLTEVHPSSTTTEVTSATTTTQTTTTATMSMTTRTDAHWIIVRAVTDMGNASTMAMNATATTSAAPPLSEAQEGNASLPAIPSGGMNTTDEAWMSEAGNESKQGNHSDTKATHSATVAGTAENVTSAGLQNEAARANLTDESWGGEVVETTANSTANSTTTENYTALVNTSTTANSAATEDGGLENGTAQHLPAPTLTTTRMNVGDSTSTPSPRVTTARTTSTMPRVSLADMSHNVSTTADETNETILAVTSTSIFDTDSTTAEALATTSARAAETTDSSAGAGDASESTTRTAEASETTTPHLPAACFQKDVAYFPLDMLTHPVIRVGNVRDCEKRCAGIEGCAHFSYWVPGHHCHVQGKRAMKISSLLFVSGDRACGEEVMVDDAQEKSNRTTRAMQMKFVETPWFAGVPLPFRGGLATETVALVSVSLLLGLLALRRSHRFQEWLPLAEHSSRFWPSSSRFFYAAFPRTRARARGDEPGPWGSSYRGAQQFLGQDSGYVSLTPSVTASL